MRAMWVRGRSPDERREMAERFDDRLDPLMTALGIVLALYSVVFFASIAGSLGAYYLERRTEAVQETVAASE